MMRGMFAAISGLKNHQVMLDVTANDIANVNTIGYKSARTTFKDSLTQLQRGASGTTGANGGTNAAQVGLGVGLGSIDNLMTGGALQSTGNALDVAIQGEGFFRVAQTVAAGDRRAAGTDAVHARRQLHHQRRTATCSRRRASTSSAAPAGAGGDRPAAPDPGRRHERRHRPGRLGVLHPGRRRRAHDRGLPRRSPRSRTPRASSARRATAGSPPRTPAPPQVDIAGQRRQGPHHRGRDRDVQRGPRPDVHEHDHRAARLPGQLARHLDLGRDAAGPGQPEALVTSPSAAATAASRSPGEAKPCSPTRCERPATAGPSRFKAGARVPTHRAEHDPPPPTGPRATPLPPEPRPRPARSRRARTPS